MMNKITILLLLPLLAFTSGSLKSQPADVPYHYQDVAVDFGVKQGKELTARMIEYSRYFYYNKTKARTLPFPPESYITISEDIKVKEVAPWIRLRFSDINLGENSYLEITSFQDNDVQYFNSQSLDEWENQTAFFAGNGVNIKLHIAPGDRNIAAKVKELTIGEFLGNQVPTDYLCYSDSRYSSGYPNVDGRILPIGCTGWVTAGGFYITAGHCLNVTSYDLQVIQFNVPESLCDGTLVPCSIQDQYPIIFSSRVYQELDAGDDWGIFNVGTNSNSGKTPAETERSYYHLSKSLAPSYILVRGFGTDQNPSGCTGSYNSYSQTLQYDIGSSLGEYFNGSSDVYFEYLVDTQGGSSGSVLQSSGISGVSAHAIGVHTHGGCSPPSYGNKGTSFEADDTEAAMNSYWQSNCEYVDEGHHFSSTIGSSVLPHESIQTALNQADAGHGPGVSALELIMVAGSNNGSGGVYNESVSYSGASNGVVIRRSVGAIKIGPGASDLSNKAVENKSVEPVPQEKRSLTKTSTGAFNEKQILPGQTTPYENIGSSRKK
jgi:hypothetical protein